MKIIRFIFALITIPALNTSAALHEGMLISQKQISRLSTRAPQSIRQSMSTHASSDYAESWGVISNLTQAKEMARLIISGKDDFFNRSELKEKGYHLALPKSFGIWYRGVNNKKFKLTPGVQRLINPELSVDEQTTYLEETGMFTEYRLRSPEVHHVFNNPDLHRSIDNTMSWLTFMQHYGLPTRLLDWTSDVKTALFFAVNNSEKEHGRIHILNAVRLNNYVLGEKGFGVCAQDEIWVSLRAELSLARNLENLLERKTVFEHESFITLMKKDEDLAQLLQNLEMPLAVEARRYNPRIVSQQGYFTIHGGKIFPRTMETTIPRPKTLEELNYEAIQSGHLPFLIAIDIENQEKILRELEEDNITELTLLGESGDELTKKMELLAKRLKNKWALERIY